MGSHRGLGEVMLRTLCQDRDNQGLKVQRGAVNYYCIQRLNGSEVMALYLLIYKHIRM